MKTYDYFVTEKVNSMAEIKRIDREEEKRKQREKRKARTDAAIKRVQEKETAARAQAPERREQEQARKQREARKAAATQRVADKSKEATLSNVTSKGSRLGGQKQTITRNTPPTKPQPESPQQQKQQSKKRSKPNAEREKARREREAVENIEKRKGGFGGGIKSALGGDVIGMQPRKGETEEEKEKREEMNRRNKAAFSKKKVQQTGNLAKSVVRGVGSALAKDSSDGQGNFEGKEGGNLSGGSRNIDRTKQS